MKIVDTYNAVVGAIVAVLTAMLGAYWFLFLFFLMFNVLDWITGTYKAKQLNKESSKAGWIGAAKKVFYWFIIVIAFCIPSMLGAIGTLVGINLAFLDLIGWFTLATLMINELRSILENLVEVGVNVPDYLIDGLAITAKLLNSKTPAHEDKED